MTIALRVHTHIRRIKTKVKIKNTDSPVKSNRLGTDPLSLQ